MKVLLFDLSEAKTIRKIRANSLFYNSLSCKSNQSTRFCNNNIT